MFYFMNNAIYPTLNFFVLNNRPRFSAWWTKRMVWWIEGVEKPLAANPYPRRTNRSSDCSSRGNPSRTFAPSRDADGYPI